MSPCVEAPGRVHCPPAVFSIEDLYGDVEMACMSPWRETGAGCRPTSILLHQLHQRVQRGGPARHVQGAEGVLGGGHHQHRRLDAGHVVDWVVPATSRSPGGRGPCSASPPCTWPRMPLWSECCMQQQADNVLWAYG